MFPNLFVIGAAKAGTTSLHHYLGQHPDIFMSSVKEPNYFAFSGRVPDYAGPPEPPNSFFERDRLRRETYQLSVLDRGAYERLFLQGRDKAVRGESSAAYLHFPEAAGRIREAVPDARIVAILRDPVERAFSKYSQMRRDRVEPLATFEEAVEAEPQRQRAGWAPTWLYLERGFYGRQFAPYVELFDRGRIHVLLYDDLRRDPDACLRAIFAFLGVDPGVPIDTSERHNVSATAQVPRSGLLYKMIARPYLLSARLQSLVPEPLVARIRPMARRLLLKPSAPAPAQRLSPETRTALIERFRPDIEKLQQLIGRDLSHWLRTSSAVTCR